MSTLDGDAADVLAALCNEHGVASARITALGEPPADGPSRVVPLGGGDHLRVDFTEAETPELEAAVERTARALRELRRRWDAARLPPLVHGKAAAPLTERVHERIGRFLVALADIDRASNAFVVRRGTLVASARPASDAESTRWPFLSRRVLTVHAPGSSHGEIVDPDAYAMTFWYDAALVVLLAEPYAVDFVRHRCRQVARELSTLLPMLDPDPETPAAIRPRRPTQH